MFGFIWVLLEKIAARVLRQDIERWRDQMASWKDSVSMLEDKLDVRRSEFIKLKADHDREIENLQQKVRDQEMLVDQKTETIKSLKNINSSLEDRDKKAAERIVHLSEHLQEVRNKLADRDVEKMKLEKKITECKLALED